MEFEGFDWDTGNRDKCRKHGVPIQEIEDLFFSEIAVGPDVEHSIVEERFKAIGRTGSGRHVLVAFTLRYRDGETLIRPVSARYMHGKEVSYYGKRKAHP